MHYQNWNGPRNFNFVSSTNVSDSGKILTPSQLPTATKDKNNLHLWAQVQQKLCLTLAKCVLWNRVLCSHCLRKTLESLLQPQTPPDNRNSSSLLARQLDQGQLQGWQKCKCFALASPRRITQKCGGAHLCTSVVLLALGVTFTVRLGSLVLTSDPALVKVGDLSPRHFRKTRKRSLENNPVLGSSGSFTLP